MRAVLFDVDGTLIKVGGAGREALARGVAAVVGLPSERVRAAAAEIDFRGRTDAAILDDLGARLGIALPGLVPEVVAAYLAALDDTLAAASRELLPGVASLIERLERQGRVVVGLLTGNIRPAARRKLDCFGLGHLVERPGGFAEDGRDRAIVAAAAVRRLAAAGVPAARTVVVGDTELDVAAARAAGCRAVAVATGWTDAATLAASGPDLCLRDLEDPRPVLDLLERL